jgi:hypothetical protein
MSKAKSYELEGYGIVDIYPMPLIMRPFAIAMVWNKKIRCSASAPSQRMIRHEVVHTLQQKEVGKFINYLWLYVKYWFKSGLSYYHHPMEKDAREYEKMPNFADVRPKENWKSYL